MQNRKKGFTGGWPVMPPPMIKSVAVFVKRKENNN
jgi:hypothetical protein